MKRTPFLLFLLVLVLTAGPLAVRGQYLTWHYDQDIQKDDVHAGQEARVAASGTKAVAVWQKSDGSGTRIYSSYSTNGGKTWSAGRIIDVSTTLPAYYPVVAMTGSNVVALFKKYHLASGGTPASYRAHAAASSDGGKTWRPDILIDDNAGFFVERLTVAMSGARVVAAWFQPDSTPRFRIYANSSSDYGRTWRTDQLLDATTGWDSEFPEVALSGANAVVVWWRYDGTKVRIYSNSSQDGGTSWHSEQLLNPSLGQDAGSPDVAVSGSRAVAVWSKQGANGYNHIYSNYSLDGGLTWHSDQEAENYVLNHAYGPRVVLSGTKVILVFYRYESLSSYRAQANTSTDGGVSWGVPKTINAAGSLSMGQPELSLNGTRAAAVWTEGDGSEVRVCSSHSVNSGATWRSTQKLDGVVGVVGESPQIALSTAGAVAVWLQKGSSTNHVASNYANYTASQKYLLLPPKLASPVDGATGLSTSVNLTWLDTNSSPQEVKYKLRIKVAGGTYAVYNLAQNSVNYLKTGLKRGKTYYWNVMAVGNGTTILNSTWANGGTDFKFTVQP